MVARRREAGVAQSSATTRLCDPGPDRVLRALRLYGDRHGVQCRRPSCAEAKDGQILLSQRVNVALRGSVVTEQVGALALKGITQPVVAYNVPLVGGQAAFRVIEGRAPSA